ncbi:hypothetical protein ASE03_30445 [Kitasatospora sp. Root187]|nr:hypothetical protein ASC99_35925 [Kitasatospora sp. Root107]KRB66951.1 hypothetical protein ASE03_30445 [Kitasatospora sp. Root187]
MAVGGAFAVALSLASPVAFAAGPTATPSSGEIAALDAERAKARPATEADQAFVKAKSTGQNVVIDSLTSEFTETAATPAGHLAVTSHPDQQRVRRGNAWAALDATLAANADGTYSPKSSVSGLRMSKGGDGPLATMASTDGKKLSLTAPFSLPAPTVDADGDGLVYPNVVPDVDLKVTATKLGGLTTVFVVKTQAAAASPQLKTLRFATAVDGVTVSADQAGNLTATAADGKPRWTAPAPQMWDSSTAAAAKTDASSPRMLAQSQTEASTSDDSTPKTTTVSTADGPGANSKTVTMSVTTDAAGVSLTPSQDLLTHGTAPYFIDPAWLPWAPSANAWTWVQSAHPDANNWQRSGSNDQDHPGVGVCAYYAAGGSCSPADTYRTFYQFDINPLRGAVVHYATMNLEEYVSADWSCTNNYPLDLYLTGAIGSGTRWGNQPGKMGGSLGQQWVGGSGHTNCYNNVPFQYNVTGTVQTWVNNGQLTFGLYGNESNQNAFKRFTYQPSLYIEYDRIPYQPTNPGASPAPRIVNTTDAYQACDNSDSSAWAWVGAGSQQAGAISLDATVTSPVQAQLYSWTHIWDYNLPGVPDVDGGWSALVGNGTTASWKVRAGAIQDGHAYGFGIFAGDQLVDWSPSTATCHFKADLTPPTASFPTTVSDLNTQFPPSGNGQVTTLTTGKAGYVPFTGTDPNPSGLGSSGLACLRWSFDPQFAGAAWQCGTSMPTSQIPVTPSRWGTHILYVQAQDKAGNLSPAAQYAFYVPWNPNGPAPVFGDITGDSAPDIVTADASGNLRAYTVPGNPLALAPATLLAAPKANAPGATWTGVKTTHRGSLRGGMNVDDLIAHKDGDPTLKLYKNPGNTNIPGALDASSSLLRPGCTTTPNCTGYATDWAAVLNVAALGDPKTSGLDTSKKFLNRTGLFTVETAPNNEGALWYYPTIDDSTFGTPVKIAATGWKDIDLISPGDWTGQGRPGLWGRNRANGQLHGYTFNTGTATFTDEYDNVTSYTVITGIATDTVIGAVSSTTWPLIGSDGDLTGSGHPSLWAITPAGQVQIWTGQPTGTPTAPGYAWATGPDTISSTAINPLRWKLNNTVNDTTNTNNLTNYNPYTFGPDHTGTANGAAVFNATNYLQGVNPGLDTTKSYSVAAWLKINKTTDWQTAVCLAGSQRSPFYLQYSKSYGTWAFIAAGTDDANTGTYYAAHATTPAETGKWVHLVGTYNADTQAMTLYVNGTAVGATTNQNPWKTTGPVIIGASAATDYPLSNQTDGSISDVRLYPYTLTSQQVQSAMTGS